MSRSAKLAVPDWPATDRAAWECAVAVGDLLETPGPAAHWRPKTQLLVADGYGFWLAWLEAQNLLDRSVGPEERLIPTNVVGYVTDLQTKLAPNSVVIRMGRLIAAIQVMAPQADQSRLSNLKRRLARNARPVRRKADRLRSSVELYQTGIGGIDRQGPA